MCALRWWRLRWRQRGLDQCVGNELRCSKREGMNARGGLHAFDLLPSRLETSASARVVHTLFLHARRDAGTSELLAGLAAESTECVADWQSVVVQGRL